MYMEWEKYMSIPCCEEPEQVECQVCKGDGYFFFSPERGHISKREYNNLNILQKRDVDVYDCECNGTGCILS